MPLRLSYKKKGWGGEKKQQFPVAHLNAITVEIYDHENEVTQTLARHFFPTKTAAAAQFFVCMFKKMKEDKKI